MHDDFNPPNSQALTDRPDDARSASYTAQDEKPRETPLSENLKRLIRAWPNLSAQAKTDILAMVQQQDGMEATR